MIDLLKLIDEARRLRPHTKRGYANAVRQWLTFAGTDPHSWTVARCQAFYDQLVTRVSIATANVMLGALSWVLSRAAALYPHAGVVDVTAAVDRYKTEGEDTLGKSPNRRRHALKAAQARKLLEACAGGDLLDLRDHAAVLLGLYTGMRRMSLVSVSLAGVVDHGAFVTLNVVLKGGGRYDLPLDTRAWGLLAPYRAALARAGHRSTLFPSIRQPHASIDAPLGQRTIGTRGMTEDGLYRALARRARAAGLATFSPHLFRHTFATWCRADKVPDYLIEVVTGHKSNRGMVDRVYTDTTALYADVARQCYDAVNRRLAGADA